MCSFQKARAVPFGAALHPFAEAIRGLRTTLYQIIFLGAMGRSENLQEVKGGREKWINL
jgi:hypothetical protein